MTHDVDYAILIDAARAYPWNTPTQLVTGRYQARCKSGYITVHNQNGERVAQ